MAAMFISLPSRTLDGYDPKMPPRMLPSEVVVRQQLRILTRSMPGAVKGDRELVHRARVASRRLREALPLIVPGQRGRKIERKIRKLTRALGPVRELDVALLTLEQLRRAGEVPAAGIARLQQQVSLERRRLHTEMCAEVSRVDLPKLQRRAINAAHRAAEAKPERRHNTKQAADARPRAARRAARLRAAIDNAAGIYLPDRLHEVRVAVKKLRYTLELARDLRGSRAEAPIRTLREAQDLLGRMHDHEVLIARVRAVQSSPTAPTLKLSGDLDRLVRRLETECRQIHGHYMTLRNKLLAVCDRTIAAAGDRTRGSSLSPAA
jgi:CHAD domain-containing protein